MEIELPAFLQSGERAQNDSMNLAKTYLRKYYGSRIPGGTRGLTGALFDRLDPDPHPNAFTAADLLAPSFLSVPVNGYMVRDLLYEQSKKFSLLLKAMGDDRDFFVGRDVGEGLERGVELENALRQIFGMGPVTASKLIAHKRPQLYPIYDSVVAGHLGLRHELLGPVYASFQGDSDMHDYLVAVREDVGLDSGVSPLRIFDVLVWMDAKSGRS